MASRRAAQTGYRTQRLLPGYTYHGFAMQADMRILAGGASGSIFYTSTVDLVTLATASP